MPFACRATLPFPGRVTESEVPLPAASHAGRSPSRTLRYRVMQFFLLAACVGFTSAFKLNAPALPKAQLAKAGAAVSAAAVTFHSEAAHAKSVLGVNGALDFGPRERERSHRTQSPTRLRVGSRALTVLMRHTHLTIDLVRRARASCRRPARR